MARKYRRFYFSWLGRFPGVGLPEMVVFYNYKHASLQDKFQVPKKQEMYKQQLKVCQYDVMSWTPHRLGGKYVLND
jgi:hypothetical protein